MNFESVTYYEVEWFSKSTNGWVSTRNQKGVILQYRSLIELWPDYRTAQKLMGEANVRMVTITRTYSQ